MSDSLSSKTGPLAAAALVLGLLAGGAGIWFGASRFDGDPGQAPEGLKAATLLPSPKPLARFQLVDQDAAPYGPDQLAGRWTFIFFGYTSCPDVCPTTMATLDALERRLASSGAGQHADFLFVSVDPERDDPPRLSEYVRYFNPRFLGATGTEDQLHTLTRQLGVIYARVENQDTAMGYLMDHSAAILLIDPEVRLAAIFSAPHDIDAMAADFRAIAAR